MLLCIRVHFCTKVTLGVVYLDWLERKRGPVLGQNWCDNLTKMNLKHESVPFRHRNLKNLSKNWVLQHLNPTPMPSICNNKYIRMRLVLRHFLIFNKSTERTKTTVIYRVSTNTFWFPYPVWDSQPQSPGVSKLQVMVMKKHFSSARIWLTDLFLIGFFLFCGF